MRARLPGIVVIVVCCAAAIACVSGTYQRVDSQPPVTAPAPPGAADQPFFDDLNPYGEWVYVSGPGWVWSPYEVPSGWRPYQLGHWVLTNYGWTWASDEDFGWAVYHYGRWLNDTGYGWVWVPGTEWGPAWVAWHEGGGWVGWAPLPWQVTWRAGVGLDWGGLSVGVALGPSAWYFVPARYMVDPGLRGYIAPVSRNVTLIRNTTNVTNYTSIDNRVVNQSVRVETIGRAVGHTIPRYHLEGAATPESARGGKVRGDRFVVFRPDPARGTQSHGRLAAPAVAPQPEPAAAPQTEAPAAPHAPQPHKTRTEQHPSHFLKSLEQASEWTQAPRKPPTQGPPAASPAPAAPPAPSTPPSPAAPPATPPRPEAGRTPPARAKGRGASDADAKHGKPKPADGTSEKADPDKSKTPSD